MYARQVCSRGGAIRGSDNCHSDESCFVHLLGMFPGRPLPTVTWWIDEQMVDDSYYSESGDTVINKLTDMKATRYSIWHDFRMYL